MCSIKKAAQWMEVPDGSTRKLKAGTKVPAKAEKNAIANTLRMYHLQLTRRRQRRRR